MADDKRITEHKSLGLNYMLMNSSELSTEDMRRQWKNFYREHDIAADIDEIFIPQKPTEGNYGLIIIPEGMTYESALSISKKYFLVLVVVDKKYEAFFTDPDFFHDTRTSAKSYAAWVRWGKIPDAKNLGLSAENADTEMENGMTLIERMLFGLKYFLETGIHPDSGGYGTLCSGSSFEKDGKKQVPYVRYVSMTKRIYINSCPRVQRTPNFAVREIILF